jgi:hypothetical protein
VGSLRDFRLCLDKRASDGSGKANLARDSGSAVWGAVFSLEAHEIERLDGFEPGYARIVVPVELRAGGALDAHVYLSEQRAEGLRAHVWYKELVLAGAREHALPDEWLALLERIPVIG